MRLILDADAIIKLNRAGILDVLISAHECLVTQTVYEEVVVTGRAKGYVDAEPIAAILENSRRVDVEARIEDVSLGRGEVSILIAIRTLPVDAAITDDQRFRARLSRDGHSGLTSTEIVVLLVREGWLDLSQGLESLDRVRESVREDLYRRARTQILAIEEDQG